MSPDVRDCQPAGAIISSLHGVTECLKEEVWSQIKTRVKAMCETKTCRKVKCESCGTVLPSDWSQLEGQPCAVCGSDSLHISLQICDRIVAREQIKGKVKNPRYKSKRNRPSREFKVGSEPQRGRPGKWAYVCRDINREHNTYDETVVDEETGQVLRECHQPLSEHKGHGSDKNRPPHAQCQKE